MSTEKEFNGAYWMMKTEAEFKLGWMRLGVDGWWSKGLPFTLSTKLGATSVYAEKCSDGWWWCSFKGPHYEGARGGESGKTRAEAATKLIRSKLCEIEKDAAAKVVTA